jgi:hypothetical protein
MGVLNMLSRVILILLLIPCFGLARENRYEIEGGSLSTKNMEIHGYNQGNVTSGWKSNEPTARFEFWSVNKSGWNWGIVLQPLYAHYSGELQDDLNNKGKVYHRGTQGELNYQFHTIRGSANYNLISSAQGRSYLRIGGSLVARYADLKFSNSESSFHDTNFIAIPLFNLESELALFSNVGFFMRSDFLPSPTENIFLDGLYDVLFALRSHLDRKKTFDIGTRLFFGGYDPKTVDDYANKIFFYAFVLRYSW